MNRATIGLVLFILAPLPAGARALSASGLPDDSVPGIVIVRDERARATYYEPRFDRWPQPDVAIYPTIARSDAGSRTVALRTTIKDVRLRSMDRFEVRVDGDTVSLPLDQKDAVTFDGSGCRSITRVNVGQQEALVRKIATGRQVEVSFGKGEPRHYRLDADDLDRFKRIVTLLDAKELPSPRAPSDGKSKEGDVAQPKLIPASKVQPEYPRPALTSGKPRSAEVFLSAHILKNGSVGDVSVLRPAGGYCGFEEAALAAVRKWRYEPATRNNELVDMDLTIVIDFSTQH